ncbi:MAG: hypothetical protein J7647_00955 [Cyanobacteria bacterium SBLK]|nr:hypothetical protein [Cyanobacteria bacterium SBLK]
MQEERLKHLIDEIRRSPKNSLTWRKAMNRLLLEIQNLQGLTQSTHPDYPAVLNDILLRLTEEIHEFEPQHSSLTASLVAWIELKLRLKYAVRDLHRSPRSRARTTPKTIKEEFREQSRKKPLSLDTPVASEAGETFRDRLSSPLDNFWELQAEIEREQQQQKHVRIGLKLQDYIERDPEGKLQGCHPKAYPYCHCQMLSQRLLLKHPPDRLAQIAKEFQIKYHTLNWHWHNKALPLLRSIAIEFGYSTNNEP